MVKKAHQDPKGGLNAAGRAHFKKTEGANLKPPAPNPKSKESKGRKASFCARMSGVKGPMKKPNGEPTRKALALSKWKC
jgi:hypothetical protein